MSVLGSFGAFVAQFPDAVACGVVMAAVGGAFGVFVVLRRIVFVSVALGEASTFGSAAALACGLAPFTGSLVATAAALGIVAVSGRGRRLPADAALAFVFLAASAGSVLVVARSGFGLEEVKAMLYGDLVVCGAGDLRLLACTGLPALVALALSLRPLACSLFDPEASRTMGVRCGFWNVLYAALLGLVVAGAGRSGGALLVCSDLVLPAATALLVARRLVPALVLASIFGVFTTLVGFGLAVATDLPVNPTIIAVSGTMFAFVWIGRAAVGRLSAH